MDHSFQKIVIVGAGQMGTSAALAARRAYPHMEIVVLDTDPTLEQAFYDKFKPTDTPADNVVFTTDATLADGADVVLLATPISQFENAVKEVAAYIRPTTIFTDIGSVKGLSMKRIKNALKKFGLDNDYVPFHILNGNAGAGPTTASIDVYKAPGVLVPDEASQSAESAVASFFKGLGTKLFTMPAQTHDKLLGTMSHLEYAAMFAFMETDIMKEALNTQGLTDPGNWVQRMTRIADAGPEMWASIFGDNKKQILETAAAFRTILLDTKEHMDVLSSASLSSTEENTPSTFHRYGNMTIGPDNQYIEKRPQLPTQPFEPADYADKNLQLSAMAGILSFAITANVKRVENETGQRIGDIANPSLKDGLAPFAVAPEAVQELIKRYRTELPGMIDDYVANFDRIIDQISKLDHEETNTHDKTGGPTIGQKTRLALKSLIATISSNRKGLTQTFSRTIQQAFGRPTPVPFHPTSRTFAPTC